jgi:hypothetical protein
MKIVVYDDRVEVHKEDLLEQAENLRHTDLFIKAVDLFIAVCEERDMIKFRREVLFNSKQDRQWAISNCEERYDNARLKLKDMLKDFK